MSGYESEGPGIVSVAVSIVSELAVIGCLLYALKVTIKDRSGLNDAEKVSRIWSRAPEIIYQPVSNALPFAVLVGIGGQTLLLILVIMAFDFVNLSVLASLMYPVLYPLTACIATGTALIVFTSTSQRSWLLCLGVSALASTSMYLSGFLVTHQVDRVERQLGNHQGAFVLGADAVFYAGTAILIPWIFSDYMKQNSAARLIYNSTIVPPWVKLDRSIMVAAAPLLVVEVFIKLLQRHFLYGNGYLTIVVFDLANIIALTIGTLTAIISVNRSLMVNEFQWQWRAFLTPAAPTAVYALLGLLYRLITIGFEVVPGQLFAGARGTINMGTCGAVGTYIYLRLAERYTRAQLGDAAAFEEPDVFLADDDDEDNEILEV